MTRLKLAIHTDIIADYLIHHGTNAPALRVAMMKFFCYTTVFNAIELFAMAKSDRERKSVVASMGAMKILGLNAKQAPRYGAWFAEHPRMDTLTLLVAGICAESKLPILTGNGEMFRGFSGLRVVDPASIHEDVSAEKILASGATM